MMGRAIAALLVVTAVSCKPSKEPAPMNRKNPSDVTAALLKDRIVVLGAELDEELGTRIIAQLLYLESVDSTREIRLYIDSPGGSAISSLAILGTINDIKPPVSTVCVGRASGVAAMLLASGAKGRRFAIAEAGISLERLEAVGDSGEATVRLKQDYMQELANGAGQSLKTVDTDCQAQRSFSASDAKQYGLIDGVVPKPAGW